MKTTLQKCWMNNANRACLPLHGSPTTQPHSHTTEFKLTHPPNVALILKIVNKETNTKSCFFWSVPPTLYYIAIKIKEVLELKKNVRQGSRWAGKGHEKIPRLCSFLFISILTEQCSSILDTPELLPKNTLHNGL